MDLELVKKSLESNREHKESIPHRRQLYNSLVLSGLSIDLIEPDRILCSLRVPHFFRNDGKYLHGGVIATLVDLVGSAVLIASGHPTSGVSLELNVSYLGAAFVGEEIEIEAKLLQPANVVGVTSVEVRKKKNGKLIALARHTKYLAVSSKL